MAAAPVLTCAGDPVRTISIETPTHGRALIKDASSSFSSSGGLLVGFHGYAQSAGDMLAELELIPGSERWTLVSVQGLHRFYARGHGNVVASWMTREDREQAIADNLGYVNRVVHAALQGVGDEATVVFLGFSQGVAMAYRAAVMGERRAGGLIAIGGDVPSDVQEASADRFPPILIAAGQSDEWYTAAKVEADEVFLRARGLRHEIFHYAGGHVWTAELRGRIHKVLDKLG
jgi:predicted esterase